MGRERLQQPVVQLIDDRDPGSGRPGQPRCDRRQVVSDRVAARWLVLPAVHVVAGHGGPPSSAVTAAENSCQEDRSSLSARRPDGVSW
jgi:hypothetical protein